MRGAFVVGAALFAFAGAGPPVAAQQGVAPAGAPTGLTRGPQAAALARSLLADVPDRVKEAQEHRWGPGLSWLQSVTLFEAPLESRWPGVCVVTAYEVNVLPPPLMIGPAGHTPPTPRPRVAAISSGVRYAYAGTGPVGVYDNEGMVRTRAACAGRASAADFFTADAHQTVLPALKALESVRHSARAGRPLIAACANPDQSCSDQRGVIINELTLDRLKHVRGVACPRAPASAPTCLELQFRDTSGRGAWTMILNGPGESPHVLLRRQQAGS